MVACTFASRKRGRRNLHGGGLGVLRSPMPPSTAQRMLLLLAEQAGDADGPGTQAGIATRLGISRSQASRLASLLVKQGLVSKRQERFAGFARSVALYALTPAGEAQVHQL